MSVDLLGLDFFPSAPAAAPQQAPAASAGAAPQQKSPSIVEEFYPPASASVVRNPPPQAEPDQQLARRRFSVRCEGRWRIRNAPSLNSKVVGTIAHGTIVIAEDVQDPDGKEIDFSLDVATMRMPDGTQVPTNQQVVHSITSLWVKVFRFEASDPMDVSEIKRDTSSGGVLYCLRRNALGYGLYELGVEAVDGPLVMPPDFLSSELRLDAQQAAADKSEDCSLTWKLLGAADSVSQFFSSGSVVEESSGTTEGMGMSARKRPEDMFEAKQRENLKKAAHTLKCSVQKLVDKLKPKVASDADITVALAKDLRRHFSRLRTSLRVAFSSGANDSCLIVTPTSPDEAEKPPPMLLETSDSAAPAAPREGTIAEMEQFLERCGQMEKQPGSSLSSELRLELVNFSARHVKDLDQYVWNLGKSISIEGGYVITESGTSSLVQTISINGYASAAAASPQPQAAKTTSAFMPLLPPPPAPTRGVGSGGGQLI